MPEVQQFLPCLYRWPSSCVSTGLYLQCQGAGDFAELGMEAIWEVEVEDFPAFIVVDNKGNNFSKSGKYSS